MHELAITQSVVAAVTERTGSAPVVSVRLRVGRLAGVVPDAMRFCFELVSAGTPLEGAVLEFEQPEGRARCRACGADFVLADLLLLCDCGSADVEVVSGRELAVASVVLGDSADRAG
ncbi:MAG: hydrogenase maturation nickel metallochaperone HypA/HybF [Blastococcus sp.]